MERLEVAKLNHRFGFTEIDTFLEKENTMENIIRPATSAINVSRKATVNAVLMIFSFGERKLPYVIIAPIPKDKVKKE